MRFPAGLVGGVAIFLGCGGGAFAADPLAPTGRWTAVTTGQAARPPMGWNSWNAFHTDVTEAKVLDSAKAIVDSGLAAKGYRYINIDDGWWLKRRTTDGRMVVRTSIFPSAAVGGAEETSFKPFTDRIHAMGLKAGIYSDIGANNCSQAFAPNAPNLPEGTVAEREVGLYGHIDQDIELYFKDWAFDYIKVDACGIRAFGPNSGGVSSGQYRALDPLIDPKAIRRTNIPAVRALYQQVADALRRTNPDGDYIFSICAWGSADVRAWAKDVGNLSRTSDDITPSWTRMLANFDSAANRALYAHPGSWNDPDMLFVGHGDFDEHHLTEAKSHFALWAMLSAPLLIGYDLRNAPQSLMDILGNSDLIAVDQDPAGNQAVLAYDTDDVQILVKTLSNGHKAVAIFNRGLAPAEVTLTAGHMKFASTAPVTLKDLWTGAKLPAFSGETKLHLDPRQTLVFDAAGARTLANGLYLSEMPGRVNPAVDGVVTPQPDPTIHRMITPWGGTTDDGEPPAYTGWGGAQADATPYRQTLRIDGRTYGTGLGVLANSRLEVRADGQFRRFTAEVGVDDSTFDTDDVVTFSVYGDGKLLTTSKPIRFGQGGQTLSANISGVKTIELVARGAAAKNKAPTVVAWGNAALLND
ncbi:MAG: NPCBM/NEW2 domain-containing protein [Caulobacter sp.]|nr:NPCBM/NEW2 domain-containing protein [Caulobacter sp.]